MKRFIAILILGLISAQALALDNDTVEIRVTINKPPDITAFHAGEGNTMMEEETLEISIEAMDPNNDILGYRFIVNGVERYSGAESFYSYTLKDTDTGVNKIRVEVTDGIETKDQEVEIYIFRKPVAPPPL